MLSQKSKRIPGDGYWFSISKKKKNIYIYNGKDANEMQNGYAYWRQHLYTTISWYVEKGKNVLKTLSFLGKIHDMTVYSP